MAIKKHAGRGRRDVKWQKQRADAFADFSDGLKDVKNAKKQKIAERINTADIRLRKIYKAKLGDDMRAFEYTVEKIDRLEGDVWLKSERGKTRKIRVFDEVFGTISRGRTRASKFKHQ